MRDSDVEMSSPFISHFLLDGSGLLTKLSVKLVNDNSNSITGIKTNEYYTVDELAFPVHPGMNDQVNLRVFGLSFPRKSDGTVPAPVEQDRYTLIYSFKRGPLT